MDTQKINVVIEDDGQRSYYLNPGDGSRAHEIGTLEQCRELRSILADLIDQGSHAGKIDPHDPLVCEWISVREASEMTDITPRAIRKACVEERIPHAIPHPWAFPRRSFRLWLHDERAHKPGRK